MASVLVVDDQAVFLKAAVSLVGSVPQLTLVGQARSGEDAVEIASESRPDLVVMDVRLPGISGIEATRRILDELPATRILLVSTHEAHDLPADLNDCGATAFVRKQDLDVATLLWAAGPAR